MEAITVDNCNEGVNDKCFQSGRAQGTAIVLIQCTVLDRSVEV